MFLEKGEEIRTACHEDFNWKVLLNRIKHKNVIPVIGQGLYRVDIESEGKKNCLLYDYLAERIASECEAKIDAHENHKFSKACLEFLKKKNSADAYLDLSDFLKEITENVHLVPDNSLWKLARIRNFGIFINTTYDDLLGKVLNKVRRAKTEILSYIVGEKHLDFMDKELFKSIENSNCTLLYHIFGNFNNMKPAFPEKDILETIVEFSKDMKDYPENNFFQNLRNSTLLFIGCGYDDWLFRFFIRILSNRAYGFPRENSDFKLFAGDEFCDNKKDPFFDLLRFLRDHRAVDCYPGNGEDFVDLLFKKLNKDAVCEIIQPPNFSKVFISFEGKDREVAKRLTHNLNEDGLEVWLDEHEFKGGDKVDDKIIKAINKCTVFMPLVSRNSQQLSTDEGKLKYHIQEWQQAYTKSVEKKGIIIPVKIDDTDWMYDKFKSIYYYKIPGGDRHGDYEKLKDQLIKLLK